MVTINEQNINAITAKYIPSFVYVLNYQGKNIKTNFEPGTPLAASLVFAVPSSFLLSYLNLRQLKTY